VTAATPATATESEIPEITDDMLEPLLDVVDA
jgi:hypothetical protein